MKRSYEASPPRLPALPWDVWRLIIEWAGITLLLDPVCHQWIAVAREFEHQSLAQWLHDMADAEPVHNYIGELYLTPVYSEPREWCRQLRGIPNIIDIKFCRKVRRVMRVNEWYHQYHIQWGVKAVPSSKRRLNNVYMLWRAPRDTTLYVAARPHFNHLLKKPNDVTVVSSAVTPVLLDDDACTEKHVYIGSGPLHTIPLTHLKFSTRLWCIDHDAEIVRASETQRIETVAQYDIYDARDMVHMVYVPDANDEWDIDGVMLYLRNMKYWHHMCCKAHKSYQKKREIAFMLLPGLWYDHCLRHSEQARLAYDETVARGERHWSCVDQTMANQLCDLTRCGFLVVDARGTRIHAPHAYSEAELEQEEAPRAWLRVYVPVNIYNRVRHHLPGDIFVCVDQGSAQHHASNTMGRCFVWPGMQVERAHLIAWERQTYELDRLPGMLGLELVEFIDEDGDRRDGYLFATLLECCQQHTGMHGVWNLG